MIYYLSTRRWKTTVCLLRPLLLLFRLEYMTCFLSGREGALRWRGVGRVRSYNVAIHLHLMKFGLHTMGGAIWSELSICNVLSIINRFYDDFSYLLLL